MRTKKVAGFTLLELMIVVVIIAILASLAMYNYGRYVFRSRRVEGQNLLTAIAASEERYYTNFNQYAGSITAVAPAGLGLTANSDHGYYTASVALGAGNLTYTLTATPQGNQVNDACGNLTLDNQGNKSPAPGTMPQSSNGNCW